MPFWSICPVGRQGHAGGNCPTIQAASEHALRQGSGLPQVLEQVRRFRESDTTTPVVLMGYANPIERYDLIREVRHPLDLETPEPNHTFKPEHSKS